MAVRIALSNATLSTGTWKRCEATAFNYTASAANYDDVNTARNIPVTFSNAGNQQGIVLMFKVASIASGTLTVKLQDAAGSTTYTTDNFTVSSTFSAVSDGANTQIMYLPLTSQAVITGAGTYRYNISCNVASRLSLWRTATAADYFYSAVLDADTSAPSSNDSIIVANGYTLTHSASFTYGATNTRALVLCEGASWGYSSPAASYTATFSGTIVPSNTAQINAGSSGAGAIAIAQQATINLSGLPSTTWCDVGTNSTWGYQHNYFNFYGAKGTSLATRAASTALASQPVITTEDDMSAVWQNGDEIILFGKARSTGSDTTAYTISNISGTTLTLNTNLDYNFYEKGGILNTTRATAQCGIIITGKAGLYLCSAANASISGFNVQGAYITDLGFCNFGISAVDQTSSVSTVYYVSTNLQRFVLVQPGATYRFSFSADNLFAVLPGNGTTLYATYCNNGTYNTIFTKNGLNCFGISGNSNTLTKLSAMTATRTNATSYALGLQGSNNTVTDSLLQGAAVCVINGWAGVTVGLYASTFSDCIFDLASFYTTRWYNNAVNVTFTGCQIGNTTSGGTDEFYFDTPNYCQILCENCGIGTSGISGMSTLADGSYVRFQTYDATANDHRCYEKYGNIVSTGDGLSDTTVHTSGTGKFAMRYEPTSSSTNLSWTFSVPTGNIQNYSMFVGVWCKINNANYWSATHQMPRLTVEYDDGTYAYCQAAETTDWQLLVVPITPTTTYGQILCTLSARTDQTTTNAYVYWDDFILAYPPNVSLDLGGMDNWASGLPVVPPLAVPISAKTVSSAVWEELQSAHVTAGTMGKQIKKALTFIKALL
jgi:hypothetical protein